MEIISTCQSNPSNTQPNNEIVQATPFSQEYVTLTKEQKIHLISQANYWKAQYEQLKKKYDAPEEKNQHLTAKNKDLNNRVFGKKSEKQSSANSESTHSKKTHRNRGQQRGSKGHGRTDRSNLPVVSHTHDLKQEDKKCACCGLPYKPAPGLDECNDFIEVEVRAYTRRVHRPAYTRNPRCHCENTPVVITAPAIPRLIPRSPYLTSFWVEIILSKFHYAQPTHRYLEDLADQALSVSPGTVAGGLQKLAPLFDPIMDQLYQKQMTEALFHNDETRWEVFVEIEGKVGTRWYLWVTRSNSVIYFILDPSRSADVPRKHFENLQQEKVFIVVDRYSAYKKLARLSDIILLAFCWVHIRRDFLDAGRSYQTLECWALDWKQRIGELYHHNQLRLESWEPKKTLEQQNKCFTQHHQAVEETLNAMHQEAKRLLEDDDGVDQETALLSKSARQQQRKVCQSVLNHWEGLTLFVANPQIPLDNNIAESSIRGPVNGRKNYYGSASLWSANLAASLFSILKTLVLWGINPRYWLTAYLMACAENGGQPPNDITPYLPWKMNEIQKREFSRPPRSRINDTS
jgi:transposase